VSQWLSLTVAFALHAFYIALAMLVFVVCGRINTGAGWQAGYALRMWLLWRVYGH
jgi:hypothetical protein